MEAFLHNMEWAVGLRSDFLTPIFYGFTWLGYTTFFLIALPIGYWAWDKNKFTRLALIIFASALLNAYLKDLWQNPRPDPAIWIDPNMDASYGLPSGHTQIGIVMWFWLAYEIRKTWAWIAAAIIAAGIAFSRLYLGVHDVEDILGGAALGILSLFAYRWSFTSHFNWWRGLPFMVRLAVLAAVVIATLLLWPGDPGGSAAIGGFFLAWYAGFALDGRTARFAPAGAWWKRAISAVLGVAGVILLFDGLTGLQEVIAPASASLAALNGAIIGGFIVVLAPMLFQLLRLAQRETE
ncbi:phosphatase PAP2 family protein [bacterium AH-315-P15]|nr:phosphatase PAP2 family protein [bacterium AH-315-P15]